MASVSKPFTKPPESAQVESDAAYKRRKKMKSSFKAYLFIAPAMVFLFFFNFFPIIYAFFLSLYQRISVVKGIIPPAENFAGLANYGRLLSDPDWWNAFFNTIGYVCGSVFFGLVVSLGIA